MQDHPSHLHASAPSRREFCSTLILSTLAVAAGAPLPSRAETANPVKRKMKLCLTPGSIGVSANQTQAIDLAARHGFEAVEPFGEHLSTLPDGRIAELAGLLREKNLAWGAAGLTVEFRQDEARFAEGMKSLPKIAEALRKAGVTRVGTWLMPCDQSLTYVQNLRQHARRLREAALVLRDNGQRLGIEYVGTQTLRHIRKFPFVHTMAEARELITEIGTGNVGLVLDTWHWWMAEDGVDDIKALKNEDVVSVDVNDAPAGVPKDRQIDGRRELACATGIIDTAAFLNALQAIGYDGPVRAEPFNKALNDLDNDDACQAAATAMRKALALIG
jgi:sugar phosphate isomerase/epimerase